MLTSKIRIQDGIQPTTVSLSGGHLISSAESYHAVKRRSGWTKLWQMIPGGREYLMRAHFLLPSIAREEVEGNPPISVKFEIPYYTTSGLQVNFFVEILFFSTCRKVIKSKMAHNFQWKFEKALSSLNFKFWLKIPENIGFTQTEIHPLS